jgi:hypothetical protein
MTKTDTDARNAVAQVSVSTANERQIAKNAKKERRDLRIFHCFFTVKIRTKANLYSQMKLGNSLAAALRRCWMSYLLHLNRTSGFAFMARKRGGAKSVEVVTSVSIINGSIGVRAVIRERKRLMVI